MTDDITRARYAIEDKLVAAEAELEALDLQLLLLNDDIEDKKRTVAQLRHELADADEAITEIVNAEYEESNRREREDFYAAERARFSNDSITEWSAL